MSFEEGLAYAIGVVAITGGIIGGFAIWLWMKATKRI